MSDWRGWLGNTIPVIEFYDGEYWIGDVCQGSDFDHVLLVGVLGLCSCGRPDDVCGVIRSILERTKSKETIHWTLEEELIMHFLEKCDILEHGSGVGASWMTPRGAWLLERLLELEAMDAQP